MHTITNPLCRLLLCVAFFTHVDGVQSQQPLPSIRVSDDKLHFVDSSGKAFRVWGVNYDHDGAGLLLEDYWARPSNRMNKQAISRARSSQNGYDTFEIKPIERKAIESVAPAFLASRS